MVGPLQTSQVVRHKSRPITLMNQQWIPVLIPTKKKRQTQELSTKRHRRQQTDYSQSNSNDQLDHARLQ